MNNLKTYSIVFANDIIAGATYAAQANIINSNREFKVNSIAWDWRCRLSLAPFTNLPLEQNTTQELELGLISQPAGTMICEPFINALPAAAVASNGTTAIFYRAGKRNFDNWYIVNDLFLLFTQTNRDILNSVRFYTSILVEIQML